MQAPIKATGTSADLAKLFNCSIRTVERLVSDGTIPKASRGVYDLYACNHAYLKHLQEQTRGGTAKIKDEKSNAEIDLLRIRAQKEQLAYDQAAGKLLDATDVEQVWAKHVMSARAKLLALPSRMAAEVSGLSDPALVQAALQRTVDEALQELGGSTSE